MAARISSQLQCWVPPGPTTNQLLAADYSGCCLVSCCMHRTKRTAVVNTETNTPDIWGAVRVTTYRTCCEKGAIEPKKTPHEYQRSPSLPGMSDIKSAAQLATWLWYHVPENCGGHSSWILYNSNTTETSDVKNKYVLLSRENHKPEKNDDCFSRDGVRTGHRYPCAVLLPFFMAASSP